MTAHPSARRALALGTLAPLLLLLAPATPLDAQAGACGAPAVAAGAAPLQPGDVVRLHIWRDPELSGDFTVNESGSAVFPRIGERRVTGESPESLRRSLVEAYAPLLSHRSVEVTLLRRIQVLGAVRNPGLYPVDATMTVDDVLAQAGGITPQGHQDRVRLVHEGETVCAKLSRRATIGGSALRSGDQLFVPERGWASRNPGMVLGVATAVSSLLLALAQ